MISSNNSKTKATKPIDLRFRLGYRKVELPLVLPFSVRQLDEMISKGEFPRGIKKSEYSHQLWDKKIIDEWWMKYMEGIGKAA